MACRFIGIKKGQGNKANRQKQERKGSEFTRKIVIHGLYLTIVLLRLQKLYIGVIFG